MAPQNPTIIVGHLDDSELKRSIDTLVNEVANKTTTMAGHFTTAIGKMQDAMKDFAITQKVSVDLMKEAWRDMSKSFDAMVTAQSASTGGGKGSGKAHAPNTIGALEQEIANIKQERKELELNSDELRIQNGLLERRKNLYKEQTTSPATRILNDVLRNQPKTLSESESHLKLLESLQRKYANSTELSVAQQNHLARAIQRTKEQIEKLKPKSLQDVLNMDESSFDAIAKKMAALKRVSWANPQEQKQITDEYQRLRQEQNKLLASNAQLSRSNNYLAQSFGYIRNRIVYALTLGAITNFVKQIYEVRGQYELLERSLGVLVNSFERGSQVFNELNQMAIESPFTLMELAGAAKQLTAYNFAANEVVDTTRRLADISAALGVPMERLTYNLGQIRAQTVLNARDARDFANAGLPIVKSLSDYYTELEGKIVSTGDVYDRMSKKMVSYNDVMAVLNKMTDEGGKFFEFQAKQAQTLRVQMANLTLAWNNMLNEMGRGNQGLLSLPIQGLKVMLQNWASLNRVLKNVVLSFGLLKVAQMAAIRYNWQFAASAGGAAKMMGFLGNVFKSFIASTKAIATNPWTWISVGIFAFVDLIGQMRAAKQATAELNEEIRNGATEASQANLDFLGNKGNKATLELAKQNKLTAEQGEKAWQAIEQQISTSAMSANKLLGGLWAIDDINERVRKGFEYTESIQQAQAALQDLQEDTITLTKDKGWWGVFGEGLVSDLKDLQEELGGISGGVGLFDNEGKLKDVSEGFVEYREELEKTAESINNFIVAHNITDPLQINEILERVKTVIKTKNPEIKGELATLFDVTLDQRMMFLTNGAIDQNTSLWKMFLDRLKHNYSSTFQGITNDIYKENAQLSKEQQKAVDANLEYFKNTMPYYYDAIESMVSDASKLRINIGVTFGVQKLTDFQDQVNKRIANAPKVLDFGTEAMLPTQNDNLSSWVKTQQDAIAKLGEENKKYKKDDTEWSKEQIKNNDIEIQQRKNLLDLFNQSYEKEKKGVRGGSKKDPMLDTLKQTVDIVKKLQSEYDTLTKSGASSAEALDDVRKRYSRTIAILNNDLQGFGLPQLNLDMIKGRNPNDVLEYFQKISDILTNKGLSTLERQKAVEVVIQEFSLKAKTYNLDMITKGLNSELDKLKDEYELAVELDANPELGNMFTDMFGIDTSDFPRTIDEYMNRVQQEFDKMRKKRNFSAPLNIFKAGDKEWEEWGRQVGLVVDVLDENGNVIDKNTDALDKLTPKFKEAQGVAKKWAQDTIKATKDLEYELGDLAKKIEIEKAKLAVLEDQAEKETNAKMKHLLELQVQKQKEAIEKLKMESVKLLPFYEDLFGDMYNVSVGRLKEIAKAAKEVMTPRKGENGVGYAQRTDSKGKVVYDIFAKDKQGDIKKTTISLEEFIKINKQIDSVQQKVAESSPWEKIKDSFSKKKGGGLKNFASGMEAIGGEMQKVANITKEIGGFAEALGVDENTVEIINDIATSIGGVATAAQGIGQIASGDYIGGAASVLSGAFSAISSWFNNADKKIVAQIEDSERAVKRLENAYRELEFAANNAYGTAVSGANQATKANKELQLVELKRQLALEQSRSSKNKDEDKIIDLTGQIIDLENEISKATSDTLNNLLGISSHGEFFENMISEMISAFKNGEDAMKVFEEKWADMIDNMIMKTIVSQVLQNWVDSLEDGAQKILDKFTEEPSKAVADLTKQMTDIYSQDAGDISEWIYDNDRAAFNEILKSLGVASPNFMRQDRGDWFNAAWNTGLAQKIADAYKGMLGGRMDTLSKNLDKASLDATGDLIDYYSMAGEDFKANYLDVILDKIKENWNFGQDSENKLSQLQQGIQGITEDQAGALEAYWNANTQQQYVQSDLLREIRNILAGGDADVQTGVQAQMLLQLQQSYAVQMAIQGILEGWATPSGQAVRVELVS